MRSSSLPQASVAPRRVTTSARRHPASASTYASGESAGELPPSTKRDLGMIESGVVENDVCAFERTALREMQTLPRQRRLARSVDAVDRDARRMTGPQPGDRGGKLLD